MAPVPGSHVSHLRQRRTFTSRRHRRASRWPLGPALAAVGGLLLLLVAPALEGAQAARVASAPYALLHHRIERQIHPQGCGAALIAAMLTALGLPGDQTTLLHEVPPRATGISLAEFAALARRHGLPGGWFRRAADDLPDGPFVAHLAKPSGHYVWVLVRGYGANLVVDPEAGVMVLGDRAFRTRFSGRVYLLEPDVAARLGDPQTVLARLAGGPG